MYCCRPKGLAQGIRYNWQLVVGEWRIESNLNQMMQIVERKEGAEGRNTQITRRRKNLTSCEL